MRLARPLLGVMALAGVSAGGLAQNDLPEVPEAYKDLWCGLAFSTSASGIVSRPDADASNVSLYIRLGQTLMVRGLEAYIAAGWPQEQAYAFSEEVAARVAGQIVGPDGVLLESWSDPDFTAEECFEIGEAEEPA